jgi:hypothetical protein
MSTTSGASKETQTTHIPIITGEESPMEELRLCVLGTVQVRWKYLHDLKGKILDLESKVTFLNMQHDRAMFYVKKEVAETLAYREKYKRVLQELEESKRTAIDDKERIRVLGMKFQKMEDAYIEERNSHCRTCEYTNRLLQENDTLKRRIDYLESRQSETHTQLGAHVEEARSPITPVSVASSPREQRQRQRQHGNPNTPRMMSDDERNEHDEWDGHGEEGSMSPTLFNYIEEMRQLEYGRGCRVSVSSRTTDCSGDPICHSDSYSD